MSKEKRAEKIYSSLPDNFHTELIKSYCDYLAKKQVALFFKRVFDIFTSFIFIVLLFIPMFVVAILVKTTSKGPVLYKQVRVTRYGKDFKILKFRTMVNNADKKGPSITILNDSRVTKVGKFLRKIRFDETPQLFNVIKGEMSFVGPRPEVPTYVEHYSNEMNITLLMKAGITCPASIAFRDEEKILNQSNDYDQTYINRILPIKAKYNIDYVKKFSFFGDCKIMFDTFLVVFHLKKWKDNPID
jgi:lipopolysaccharide/colanic/teichoic acid biosynthesis glycosyltransferase